MANVSVSYFVRVSFRLMFARGTVAGDTRHGSGQAIPGGGNMSPEFGPAALSTSAHSRP